jgi:ppGpp synthetase/RelA/SpoT-type nucleotidyltranferase
MNAPSWIRLAAAVRAIDGSGEARSHMSRWAKPEFSKKQVNAAGKALVDMQTSGDELSHALDIINNFRSIHGHPLNTFQTTLRIKGRHIDKNIIVAQRIKRLSSIELKLQRFPTMTLSQMQDIGGCRGVVGTAAEVNNLVNSYVKSDLKHKLHTHDDYMMAPKPTGYRGVHLIYRYYSDKIDTYNSLKIEMQLRSQAQHAWATAVEIVGTFTQQALKSSQGADDWLRFFALMGTALAIMEGTAPVPDTPIYADELIKELNDAAGKLDAVGRLKAYGTAPQILESPASKKNHFFLLELDAKEMKLEIKGFKSNEILNAADQYLQAERRFSQEAAGGDAVLVSVDSLASLRRAYPNYYLDTNMFVGLVEKALKGDFTAIGL